MADDLAQRLRSRMDADELELEAADEIERLSDRIAAITAELIDEQGKRVVAERELAELRERIANGVVADVAEDTRHEGSSALVAAAEKVGYYEGYRVRLVRED